MNIGIDISQVAYPTTGVGRYTRGLIEAVLDYDTENSWTFVFSAFRGSLDTKLKERITSSRHRLILLPFSPKMLGFISNVIHIFPIEIVTGPLDWFISSDWTEPKALCKKATIIHDLTYLRFPEVVHKTILKAQRQRMEHIQKESSFVLAVSASTQKDIIELLHIPALKVKVIYTGVTTKTLNKEIIKNVKNKFSISKPFVLSVGKLEPRKNIKRLINSWNTIEQNQYELLIVGPEGWDFDEKNTPIKNVRFLGAVTDDELDALYELCNFFVYPSIWEGFGYPIVEAMLHKKAVATSNLSSLKELGENHSLLFDPNSEVEIKKALLELMKNDSLKKQLGEQAYDFARQFTWKKYINELTNTLKSI